MGNLCSSSPHQDVSDPNSPHSPHSPRSPRTPSASDVESDVDSVHSSHRAVGASVTSEEKMKSAQWEDVESLVTIPFFEDLDRSNVKRIRELFQRQKLDTGVVVLREGDNHEEAMFYVIVSGSVRLSAANADGEDVVLTRLSKGAWFGEVHMVGDAIQAVTVTTEEPSVLLSMPLARYQELVQQVPELQLSVYSLARGTPFRVALREIPFFEGVEEVKLQQLAQLLEVRKCAEAEVIFRQGEEADGLYYIVEGRIHVSAAGPDGQAVHLDTLTARAWFGEIALLEHTTRTATVTTAQPCLLLFLPRDRFQRFLRVAPRVAEDGALNQMMARRTANSLKAIPLFSVLRTKQVGPMQQFDEEKLSVLGTLFRFTQYEAGNIVFREGDEADAFYIIVRGMCAVTAQGPDDETVPLGMLGQNDWFGELALLRDSPHRTTTVTCQERCVMLRLTQEHFQQFLQVAPDFEGTFRSRIGLRTAARLRDIPFFQDIRENKPWSKLDLLGQLFHFETYQTGHVLFEEGSIGDKFYIMVEGVCSITVMRHQEPLEIDRVTNGSWFGEIALLQDTPRTATVTCVSPCLILSISASKFGKFLQVAPELAETFNALVTQRTANTLRSFELFSHVNENKPWSKLELLATLFTYETAADGQVIYDFDDPPEKFYVIVRGHAAVTARSSDGEEVQLTSLGPHDHFGESALMYNQPREHRVTATDRVVLLALKADSFKRFLKMAAELKPYFEQSMHDREQNLASLQGVAVHVGDGNDGAE